MERTMGGLLRAGVLLAAGLALAGMLWALARQGPAPVSYRRFQPPAGAASWLRPGERAERLEMAGLLLLILTPVARVVFSLAAFAWERDWTYVAITSVALAALLYSLARAWL